jgi:CspA family cold shock protein
VKWCNSIESASLSFNPDKGGEDAFVHVSAIKRAGMNDMREGWKVSFELLTGYSVGQNVGGKAPRRLTGRCE